ncbi:MAG: hypothetical protein H6Q10_3649 [Acidobacteria bacterium]|nr:hypothetical protein [Acidobacteriota bacterium]
MKRSSTFGIVLCAVLAFASVAAAQSTTRRAAGTALNDTAGVSVALQAGGDSYRFTGQAKCTHERQGYIYTVPAQLWSVEQSDGTRSVHLTFWRPASGSADMFTLHLQGGGTTHFTDTVKTPNGGSPRGSGQVTFAPAGAGGTFTVNVTAANGTKISGTVRCDAFGAVYAEGGN